MRNITVLGAGAWGTALALVLAGTQQEVNLWGYDSAQVARIQSTRENKEYLPGIHLPENIKLFSDLASAIADSPFLVVVVPSHVFRENLRAIKPFLKPGQGIVWGSKGIEADTQKLFHTVVAEELGADRPAAILSGPSFAKEVADRLPTAVCVAGNQADFVRTVVACFGTPNFRVYENPDLIGVEICGGLKNVLAIAAGMSDGMGLGSNTKAALITRGVSEMARLCKAMGGRVETVMGLAGLGDLVLTATGTSRNFRFGFALGKGLSLEQASESVGRVIEGFHNTKQFYDLGGEKKVELPITEAVYHILHEGLPLKVAMEQLMSRLPKEEFAS